MPYRSLSDLPDPIKKHLPHYAQEIYMTAFNNAWKEYEDPSKRKRGGTQEEVAHSVA